MNLLKSFSMTSNVNPGKSFIYDKFYPLDFGDYIVLDTQSLQPEMHYSFWFRVIELIEPFFDKENIKIVHFIENQQYHFKHTYLNNSVSLNEKAYILKKAKFFCGTSRLYSLICSENNINQCFLKSDYSLDNTLCPEEQIIHSSGSYKGFANPTPFAINNIRPEAIAKKIIKLFFNKDVRFDNTLSIGKMFNAQITELIPNCSFSFMDNRKEEILIRLDLFFSEETLEKQLNLEKASLVTNRPIKKNLLIKYKNQIQKIFFKVEKNSDSSFLKELEDMKINYEILTSLSEDDLNKEKIKYINHKKINKLNSLNMKFLDGLDLSKVYFKSNKIIIKNEKTYPSKWHAKMNLNCADVRKEKFSLPPIIDESFKEDAEHFYFLTSEDL